MEDNINRLINRDALFPSGTEDYRFPAEPDVDDDVLLRMQTGRGSADHVHHTEDRAEVGMIKVPSNDLLDYYKYETTVGADQVLHHFKVASGQGVCLCNRLGPMGDGQACFDFKIIPRFRTPDWAKDAVIYQTYVDRFCNGDKDNNVGSCEYVYIGYPVQRIEDWSRDPSAMDVGYFYEGDFQGVQDKLDYTKSLGVEVIYLNPIFVSSSNHKYDYQDCEHTGPHFGRIVKDDGDLMDRNAMSNKGAEKYIIRSASQENLEASDTFFAEFVQETHRRGMKIVLSGISNHYGPFNRWLDTEEIYKSSGDYEPGAYETKDSPYYSFFQFRDEKDQARPRNATHDGW